MQNLDQNELRSLKGKTLVGNDGELGRIDELYVDNNDGDPTFATVDTGAFAGRSSFVPLASASLSGSTITVPYDKQLVSDAPNISTDADLSPEEEERLYVHYGIHQGSGAGYATSGTNTTTTTNTATTGITGTGNQHGTAGHDTSGPTTDDAMTRSEERLKVGTQQTEAGRARLRKYIVSEQQNVTVPVTTERATVTTEPITDANAGQAYDGPALSEEEHEVVLSSEKPVVEKETVPVERVRLGTETVTENVQVSEEVRKEQIEVDGDVDTRGGTTRGDGTLGNSVNR